MIHKRCSKSSHSRFCLKSENFKSSQKSHLSFELLFKEFFDVKAFQKLAKSGYTELTFVRSYNSEARLKYFS